MTEYITRNRAGKRQRWLAFPQTSSKERHSLEGSGGRPAESTSDPRFAPLDPPKSLIAHAKAVRARHRSRHGGKSGHLGAEKGSDEGRSLSSHLSSQKDSKEGLFQMMVGKAAAPSRPSFRAFF